MVNRRKRPEEYGRTEQAGYGAAHKRERARRLALARPSDPCSRCGLPIGPIGDGRHLHLDHDDDDRTRYRPGLSCARCNTSAPHWRQEPGRDEQDAHERAAPFVVGDEPGVVAGESQRGPGRVIVPVLAPAVTDEEAAAWRRRQAEQAAAGGNPALAREWEHSTYRPVVDW